MTEHRLIEITPATHGVEPHRQTDLQGRALPPIDNSAGRPLRLM
ncbi:hypothetical protein [Paraburkholderia sp. BL18I3N2]|nr:hypothetical protein [Paraburkholderia sp. BL18I3N2]